MTAQLYNFKCWIPESNPELVKQLCESTLKLSKLEILGFIDHHFTPHGYTCIWLLGESHLALHTYPEHAKTYLELTSCAAMKNNVFISEIKKTFEHVEILSGSVSELNI